MTVRKLWRFVVLLTVASVTAAAGPAWSAAAGPPEAGLSGLGFAPVNAPMPAPIRKQSIGEAAADRPDPFRPSAKRAAVAAAAVPVGSWLPLGPAPIGPPFLINGGFYGGVNSGRITGLAAIPSGLHPGRVVAATAGGGIWTSDDEGAHWEARTDGAADLAMGSVVDDPSNANHLIAGTGEANQCGDCHPGAGILVSTDGGQTWSLQNPGSVFSGLDIAQVAIDPSNSNHEFAATTGGLFVTSNGGVSWAKPTDPSYAPLDGSISAVVIDPTTPTTVYLGGGAGVVGKSITGGVQWAAMKTGITAPGPPSLTALAIAPSTPSTLYASVGSQAAVRLYKTINGGSSWVSVGSAPDYTGGGYSYEGTSGGAEQGWYDNVLAIDPVNPNHVLAGGIALVQTNDGGATWSNVNGQPFFGGGTNKIHPDHHALVFRGDGRVWVGEDGGAYLYTPSSGAVANANGNLNVTQFYFGFNAVSGTVLAGSQDNASARTSSGLTVPWTGIFSGDGGPSAITPNEAATQFIQANGGLYITKDAFVSTFKEITPPQSGLFTPPMSVVPNSVTPKEPTVLDGRGDLWRTTNPSAATPTWTKVTSLGLNPLLGEGVSAIATSATNPSVVYVGFTNGVIQVSTDGGATFASIGPDPTVEKFVTGLSVNPSNPKEVAASFSFNDTRYRPGLPHAALYSYTTTPGSGTWSIITGNLPSPDAVSRVVYDNGALVAATDQGVYATEAAEGASTKWARVGTEMPNVQVQDLNVQPDGLYAVTHGRGAWKLPFSSNPSQGTWVGIVGHDGFDLAGWGGSSDISQLPAGVSVSLTQGSRYVWAPATGDVRALQSPDGLKREAATYYDPNEIKVGLKFTSAYTGNLRLYALDWDTTGRRETITVAGNTTTLSGSFNGGAWVTVPISVAAGETVSISVSRTAGANAVLSGIFLGDAGAPPTVASASAPQGAWVGTLGHEGYDLAGWGGSSDISQLPAGASLSLTQGSRYVWAPSTGDARALQSPDGLKREAATYYDPNQIRLSLKFTSAYSGNLRLYALDWDTTGRRETISVGGQTATLSGSFSAGAWVTVPISVAAGETVPIVVDRTAGANAVLSGVFLGDAGAPPTVASESSPQGNWVGTYGSTGYDLAAWNGGSTDLESGPATVSLAQGSRYQWAASTGDVRALESPNTLTREAATYYDPNQIRLSVKFTSAFTGNLHLYALDWDTTTRRETISVAGQTATLSGSFTAGAWASFPVSVAAGETVPIVVDRTAGANAVLSGVFLN
jgi:hypothetical protein